MALPIPIVESPDQVRRTLEPLRSDFSVALHTCQNAFAIGAIIRVAHSFLVREVILIGSDPHYEKASMGMEKYERIVRVPDEIAFREHVQGRPVWAVEKDHARRSLYEESAYPSNVVFLFGSERAGLPMEAIRAADEVVGIPMYGINHSFPVTVAAGIVMADWARRRFADGRTL